MSLMPLKMPPYEDGAAADKRRDTFCAKMKGLLESPPRVSKKARTKKTICNQRLLDVYLLGVVW